MRFQKKEKEEIFRLFKKKLQLLLLVGRWLCKWEDVCSGYIIMVTVIPWFEGNNRVVPTSVPIWMDTNCHCNIVDEAMNLLDEIIAKGGELNLVSYNVLLTGMCKEGRTEEAIRVFRELPAKGFTPNVVSYNILLRNLCYEGRWEEANELLAEMDKDDQSPSVVTYNILITSLTLHGRTQQAFKVLDEMTRSGFKEGKVDLVVKCLDQMIQRRCNPNEGTYSAIVMLCEQGKVQDAFFIIQKLGNNQNFPLYDFYQNVISSLCRKGNTYCIRELQLCSKKREKKKKRERNERERRKRRERKMVPRVRHECN